MHVNHIIPAATKIHWAFQGIYMDLGNQFATQHSLVPRPLFFSLNITKETNGRTDKCARKIGPGTHCRGCSAHALKITQNLGNCIFCRVLFRKLYSFNFLQRCFYRFFPPAGIPVPWLQPGRSLFQPTTSSRQVFCGSSSKSKTVRSLCTCLDCSLFVTVRL